MSCYLIIDEKTNNIDSVKNFPIVQHVFTELKIAREINDYHLKYPLSTISLFNHTGKYVADMIIVQIEILTEEDEISNFKKSYGDYEYTCIDIVKYITNKIKILELESVIDNLYNSSNLDLNDIIIQKVKFTDYYYQKIKTYFNESNTPYISTSHIISDKKYDIFRKNVENCKNTSIINLVLKTYIINDLSNIVKDYFKNDVIRTCITKNNMEILERLKENHLKPRSSLEILVLNDKGIPGYYFDEKNKHMYIKKNNKYFGVCKYINGKIEELSISDSVVILYCYGKELETNPNMDILNMEYYLYEKNLKN